MELSIIDKKLAMDSRDIAKLTNKQHVHVVRDIKNMLSKLEDEKTKNGTSYNIKNYKNANGVSVTYFLLDYELTMILLTGYSVELRSKVVKRWLFLEKHYQTERKKSIETRNTFTDTLQEHGYTKQHEYIQTTQQMKKPLGIVHKKAEMTTRELDEIAASEALARVLLNNEQGFNEVNPVCVEASEIVANAKKKRLTA